SARSFRTTHGTTMTAMPAATVAASRRAAEVIDFAVEAGPFRSPGCRQLMYWFHTQPAAASEPNAQNVGRASVARAKATPSNNGRRPSAANHRTNAARNAQVT